MELREQMQLALDALRAGKVTESVSQLQEVIARAPAVAAAWANLGNAERERGQIDAALQAYEQALRFAEGGPDADWIWSNYLMTQCYREAEPGRPCWQIHEQWGQRLALAQEPTWRHRWDADRRLHVGWVSGDFRWHSVAFFLLALLRNLDREQFEITCFSNHPDTDEMTEILRSQVDAWVDIHEASDERVLQQIRRSRVDVLVDLSGHSAYHRMAVFAKRAAPVQLSWLGYPGPTGNPEIDFWMTDAIICPPSESCPWKGSRPLRLNAGCHAYHPPLSESEMPPVAVRTEHSGPTLGCFNHRAKLSRETVEMWAEVLNAAPTARLLLKSRCYQDAQACDEIRQQFQALGVAAERLELWARTPSTREHLEGYQQMDIALDTYPYAGTTTTFESLWMGVPVVTRCGVEPASRVGASILRQLGRSEWVASDRRGFVQTALRLIEDAAQRKDFRTNAREAMRLSGLTDGARFARSWQAAVRGVWQEQVRKRTES